LQFPLLVRDSSTIRRGALFPFCSSSKSDATEMPLDPVMMKWRVPPPTPSFFRSCRPFCFFDGSSFAGYFVHLIASSLALRFRCAVKDLKGGGFQASDCPPLPNTFLGIIAEFGFSTFFFHIFLPFEKWPVIESHALPCSTLSPTSGTEVIHYHHGTWRPECQAWMISPPKYTAIPR